MAETERGNTVRQGSGYVNLSAIVGVRLQYYEDQGREHYRPIASMPIADRVPASLYGEWQNSLAEVNLWVYKYWGLNTNFVKDDVSLS